MTKTSKLRAGSIALTVACFTCLGLGCAANTQGVSGALASDARAPRAGRTSTARLTGIDRELQLVMLEELDGDQSIVAVASPIVLGRMEVGDTVRIESKGLFGFELLGPGESIEDGLFSDDLPAGVTFGRKVTTTVEILDVFDQGGRGIVRAKDGSVRELTVESKAERSLLARLRPGDEVTAACTEKLAIKLER
jgi:hypothetical protein